MAKIEMISLVLPTILFFLKCDRNHDKIPEVDFLPSQNTSIPYHLVTLFVILLNVENPS